MKKKFEKHLRFKGGLAKLELETVTGNFDWEFVCDKYDSIEFVDTSRPFKFAVFVSNPFPLLRLAFLAFDLATSEAISFFFFNNQEFYWRNYTKEKNST